MIKNFDINMSSLIRAPEKTNDEKKNKQKIKITKSKYKIKANSTSVLKKIFKKIFID